MIQRGMTVLMIVLTTGWLAGAEIFVGPQAPEQDLGIVKNSLFDTGGASYADNWRPLPGNVRIHRKRRDTGDYSLFLQLREGGDGGVMQTVSLPPRRTMSLRVLATCHANAECAAVVTLIRAADGEVLAEVVVDGIERGVLAQAFETGGGGPAQLMVRVVSEAGGKALIDRVTIAAPVPGRYVRTPDYSAVDLLLASGEGLRVDADFEPRLLPQAAQMLQEAIEEITGAPVSGVGATVTVSVAEPQATTWPERESYHLAVAEGGVTIDAPAEQGAMWGMMTLIDLLRPEPDGGARIVAVDVRDEPALPWRIGQAPLGVRAANIARSLARLKVNMAEMNGDRADGAELADELRSVGIEPVVSVDDAEIDRITEALQDAVDRLGARYLLVRAPVADVEADSEMHPHRWDRPPLYEMARFAREHAGGVTVIVPACLLRSADQSMLELSPHEMLRVTPEGWPPEIVAVLPVIAGDEQEWSAAWRNAGVRYIMSDMQPFDTVVVRQALEARAAGKECLGAQMRRLPFGAMSGEMAFPAQADQAWRGLVLEE